MALLENLRDRPNREQMIEAQDRFGRPAKRHLIPDVLWILGATDTRDELRRPPSSGSAWVGSIIRRNKERAIRLPSLRAATDLPRNVGSTSAHDDNRTDFAALNQVRLPFAEWQRRNGQVTRLWSGVPNAKTL